jgi:hypothetical protein
MDFENPIVENSKKACIVIFQSLSRNYYNSFVDPIGPNFQKLFFE